MIPMRTIEVPDEEAIRKNVVAWMTEHGVSYAEFGKVIGMESGNLHNVLKGSRLITMPMATRIYRGIGKMEGLWAN